MIDPGQSALVLEAEIRKLTQTRKQLLSEIDRLNKAKQSIPTNSSLVREKLTLTEEIRMLKKKHESRLKDIESMTFLIQKAAGELTLLKREKLRGEALIGKQRETIDRLLENTELIKKGMEIYSIEEERSVRVQSDRIFEKLKSEQRRLLEGARRNQQKEADIEKRSKDLDRREKVSNDKLSEAVELKKRLKSIQMDIDTQKKEIDRNLGISRGKRAEAERLLAETRENKKSTNEYVAKQQAEIKAKIKVMQQKAAELQLKEAEVKSRKDTLDQREKQLDDKEKWIKDRTELLRANERELS